MASILKERNYYGEPNGQAKGRRKIKKEIVLIAQERISYIKRYWTERCLPENNYHLHFVGQNRIKNP